MKPTTVQKVVAVLKKAKFTKAVCGRKEKDHKDGFTVRKGLGHWIIVEPILYKSKPLNNINYILESEKYEKALNETGFYTDRNCPSPAMLRIALP